MRAPTDGERQHTARGQVSFVEQNHVNDGVHCSDCVHLGEAGNEGQKPVTACLLAAAQRATQRAKVERLDPASFACQKFEAKPEAG